MIKAFTRSLKSIVPNPEKYKFLLAVSGGVDSTVMLHLFDALNLDYGIAHCNYQLRGEDADLDAELVCGLGVQKAKLVHLIDFNTNELLAKHPKESLQMLARSLRYDWFKSLCDQNGYDYVLTAHHQDDSIESFFINLLSKTGINGLTGIPIQTGNIIRPLNPFSKEELLDYAHHNKIAYREDTSNAESKYIRNKVRNQLLPLLEEINPSYHQNIIQSIDNLKETKAIYQEHIAKAKSTFLSQSKDKCTLDLTALYEQPNSDTILYELLKEFGFNASQVKDILAQNLGKGQIHLSTDYKLVHVKNSLSIYKNETVVLDSKQIDLSKKSCTFNDAAFHFEVLPWKVGQAINKDNSIAQLDFDAISEPIEIRYWKEGDKFQPLGMNGKHQKLQDFFSNLGINRIQKSKIPLVISNGEIIWVTGLRIDERYKITSETKSVLEISFIC